VEKPQQTTPDAPPDNGGTMVMPSDNGDVDAPADKPKPSKKAKSSEPSLPGMDSGQ
jgi:hypothetical protein